jgi:hypothetical protein
MSEPVRSRRIEAIEEAMLELLLYALGAYEADLGSTARLALARQHAVTEDDGPTAYVNAARALRTRAIGLGAPPQRYDRMEWHALGL